MALKISTDDVGIKIWRDDKGQFPRYSYSISKRNDDGTFSNCYMDARFKKGVELENGTDIVIKHAFFSFNVGKDGRKYPYLMITEFETADGKSIIDVPDDIGEDAVPFK